MKARRVCQTLRRAWLFACALFLSAHAVGEGFTEAEVRTGLEGAVSVQTHIGRDFEGRVIEVTEERIILLTEVGSGSVEYTFAREDIVNVRIPGGALKPYALDLVDNGEVTAGLDLLDRLFAQRAPFFAYLPESEPMYFAEAVPLYRTHGRISEGVALAEQLAPVLSESEEIADLLRDEILFGSFLLGDERRARQLAEAWIAEEPRSAESALGWRITGALQEREGDHEKALFSYLRPIVFSGIRPMPHLDHCYAGAIGTAVLLKHWSSAQRLESEMQARGLAWPEDRARPDFSVEASLTVDSTPVQP